MDVKHENGSQGKWVIEWTSIGTHRVQRDIKGNMVRRMVQTGLIFELDEQDNEIREIHPNGEVFEYEYDSENQLIRTINSDGSVLEYEDGLPGRRVFPNGEVWKFEYGPDHLQPINITKPHGTKVEYEYDNREHTIKQTTSGPEGVEVIEYEYDDEGKLAKETISGVEGSKVIEYEYEYDDLGNTIKKTCSDGRVYEYEYEDDDIDRVLKATISGPEGVEVIEYEYDDEGFFVKETRTSY